VRKAGLIILALLVSLFMVGSAAAKPPGHAKAKFKEKSEIVKVEEAVVEGDIEETVDEETEEGIEEEAEEENNEGDVEGPEDVEEGNEAGLPTRSETVVMLAKLAGIVPVENPGISFKGNVQLSDEELGYLQALMEAGIINESFNPRGVMPPPEFTSILKKLLETVDLEETGETETEEGQIEENETDQINDETTGERNANEDETTTTTDSETSKNDVTGDNSAGEAY